MCHAKRPAICGGGSIVREARRQFLVIILVVGIAISSPATVLGAQVGAALILEDGTPVRLRLSRNLSSKEDRVGDTVDFEVLEEVRVHGVVVIAKGDIAWATITEAQPARRLGRGGKLDFVLDSVRLITGQKAALRAVKGAQGGGRVAGMTVGVVAAGILFFPAAPFFLFMKGKDVTLPRGAELTAYVNGSLTLDMALVPEAALSSAPRTSDSTNIAPQPGTPEQRTAAGLAAPLRGEAAIPAGALPPEPRDLIPAGPLPPPSLLTPVLLSKSARWTSRVAGRVVYEWSAEVENPNPVPVTVLLTISLNDGNDRQLHQAVHELTLPPSVAISAGDVGEVDESIAIVGQYWIIEVQALQDVAAGSGQTREPSPLEYAETPKMPLGTEQNPAPLTPDITPPQLIPESVRIISVRGAETQSLDLRGKLITIRCLVRANGTVAQAKVFRIEPRMSLEVAEESLRAGIELGAIEHWRFNPATKAGVPLAVWHMLSVRYEPGG